MQIRPFPAPSSSRRGFLRRLAVLRELLFDWTPWRLMLVNLLLRPLPDQLVSPFRARLYRWAGLRGIDPSVFIEGPLYLRPRRHAYRQLRIGARTEIFGPCRIEPGAEISI